MKPWSEHIFTFLHFCSLKRRNRQNKRNKQTMKLRTHPSKHHDHAYPTCVCLCILHCPQLHRTIISITCPRPKENEGKKNDSLLVSFPRSFLQCNIGSATGRREDMRDDGLVAINMIRPSHQLDRGSFEDGGCVHVFAQSLHVGKYYVTRYEHDSVKKVRLH